MGGWWFLAILVVATVVLTPVLGRYLASVYGGGPAFGDRFVNPVERAVYRITESIHGSTASGVCSSPSPGSGRSTWS